MEDQELDIRLTGLSQVKDRTKLYRWEVMRHQSEDVDVALSTDFEKDSVNSTVTLRITVRYTALRGQIRRRLLDYSADATFAVSRIDGLVDVSDEELLVSIPLLRLMLGIAIGAIRGMIAVYVAGTVLEKFPLPLYNLETLVENIVAAGQPLDA